MKDLAGYPLTQTCTDKTDAELSAFHARDNVSKRRAHVQKWLQKHQRGLGVFSAGGLVFLPLLAASAAQAQDGPVLVSSIDGVTRATLNPDGSVEVTLSNGQVATVSASEVTILPNGQIALSAAAAESIAALAAMAAGVGAAAIAAAIGGLGLAGAAAGGGGGSGDPVLVGGGGVLDVPNSQALNAGGVLSAQSFAGFAPSGSVVQITINGPDGEPLLDPDTGEPRVFQGIAEDGNYSIEIPIPDLGLEEGEYTFVIEAFEADEDDSPVGDPLGSETVVITVDTTPPEIAINTPVAENDLINIVASQSDLTITGTTNAEDGQVVTVTINGVDYTGEVSGGDWSVTIPAQDLQDLPEGTVEISFDVEDTAGNAASDNPDAVLVTTVDVDLIAPEIEIDDTLAGNNVFTKLNEAGGLEVTGTTDAGDGQIVTVTFNGETYDSDPITGPTWSVLIPPSAFDGFETGDEISGITATVRDAADNLSDTAQGPTITVDLTGPSIDINPIAVDDVINILESEGNIVISGIAEGAEGQEVTVAIASIGFTATDTVTDGQWSVTLLQADVEGLDDATTFTVTADVEDAEGIEAPQATRDFTTAYTAPTVEILGTRSGATETDLSTDNTLNAAELNQTLTIFGTTTGVADTLPVTITLPQGGTVTAFVEGNAWEVEVTSDIVQAIAGAAEEGEPLEFSATVRDSADNLSDAFDFSITADLTAPVIEIDPVAGNDQLTLANKGEEVTVSGSTDAEPGQMVTVIFNGTELAPAEVVEGGGSGDLPNSWQTIIPEGLTEALEDEEGVDEEYTLTAQVDDLAGNPSETAEATLTTDFSAPTISFDPVADDNVINFDESNDPDGVVISGTTTGLEEGRVVTIFLDGEEIGSDAVDSEGRFSITIESDDIPGDGDYTLSASATNAEDIDAVDTPRSFSVDTVAPELDITSVAGNGFFGQIARDSAGITVEGTSDAEGAEVEVTLTDKDDNTVTATAIVTDGSWTASFDGGSGTNQLGTLTEGEITVEASVTNAVGNSNTETDTATAKFTPPTVILEDLPFGAFLNEAEAAAGQTIEGEVLNGTGNPVTVSIFQTGNPDNSFFSRTITLESDNSFSLTFTPEELGVDGDLPEGGLTLRVTTSDDADNQGVAGTADFTVDRIAPEVSIATIAGQDVTGDVVINIEAREEGFRVTGNTDASEAGREVTVTIIGLMGGVGTGEIEADGSWSVMMPDGLGLSTGMPIEFRASVTDEANNTGTSDPVSSDVDLNQPTITFDMLAGDDILNIAESNAEFLTVSGSTTFFDEGNEITIQADGIDNIVVEVDGSGNFTTNIAREDVFALIAAAGGAPEFDDDGALVSAGDGKITFTAIGQNSVNNVADDANSDLVLALTPPTLEISAIDGPDGADLGVTVSSLQRDAGLEVRGISDAEGRDVTVTLTDSTGVERTAIGTVEGGEWLAVFVPGSLDDLPDDTTQISISAEVEDTNGNTAQTEATEVQTDFVAPGIAIQTVTVLGSEDEEIGDFLNIADREAGVTVSGTTDAENEQIVTVTLSASGMEDIVATGQVMSGMWSADFTSGDLADLPDDAELTWIATVSDAAGNPSGPSDAATATSALTPPTVIMDSHAIDGLITGSSTGLAEGAEVVLTLPNVDPNTPGTEFDIYTTTVDADGNWQFQVPKHPAANRFESLFLAYNQEFEIEAAVSDAAANTGDVMQGVTIYLPTGLRVEETEIDGNQVTYGVFQLEYRVGEELDFLFDGSQVDFVTGVGRSDYPLASFNPSSAVLGSGVKVVLFSLGLPPQPIEIPAFELAFDFGDDADVLARYLLVPVNPEDDGGALEVIFGSSGDDPEITVTSVDSTVRGKGGDDIINFSNGGMNTVIFEPDQTSNGTDTILGFQAGPDAKLPDQIGFAGLDHNTLRGNGQEIEALGPEHTIGLNTGFVILTETLDAIDASGLAAAAANLIGAGEDDVIYLLATDGDDSALARVTFSDPQTASAEILAQFSGLDGRLVSTDDILGFNTTPGLYG